MERQDLPLIGLPGAASKAPPAKPAPITVKGDPGRSETKPAVVQEPTARHEAVAQDDHDAAITSVRKIEEVLRDSKNAKAEREEARQRIAHLEHELAQAREQVEALKQTADQARDFQRRFEEATKAQVAATAETANLKIRANELDTKLKAAEERARNAEAAAKKHENALANAKEARDEAQYRLDAATAAIQGKPVPPKPDRKV